MSRSGHLIAGTCLRRRLRLKHEAALVQFHGRNLLLSPQALRLLPFEARERNFAGLGILPGPRASLLGKCAPQSGLGLRQFRQELIAFLSPQDLPCLHRIAFMDLQRDQTPRVLRRDIDPGQFQTSIGPVKARGPGIHALMLPPVRGGEQGQSRKGKYQ